MILQDNKDLTLGVGRTPFCGAGSAVGIASTPQRPAIIAHPPAPPSRAAFTRGKGEKNPPLLW